MKYLPKHLAKISYLIISIFFSTLIITPSVLAASYTWTDATSSGSAHNLYWSSITSSSTGQYQAAVVDGGDI